MKKIHFISIGGRIMHALALVLQARGYEVTGSDDEIYDPSLTVLREAGLAPETFGWNAERVADVDAVIVGMHARADNPELLAAQERGIPIHSFPSFVAEQVKDKRRVVIAGSHGKTTTTAMIMHVLRKLDMAFDYLVGAEIAGFDKMVQLTDAPIMLIEGDEYLSSPIDRRPKFSHYEADIAVLTGIAWDHINAFPTEEDYIAQFTDFVTKLKRDTPLHYFNDPKVEAVASPHPESYVYDGLVREGEESINYLGTVYPVQVIGQHNLQNMEAALRVCIDLGISEQDFFESIADFTGASRRLQVLSKAAGSTVFIDFAHAPSKVKATTQAVKDWYPERGLVACLELHTYSSLNQEFLPQYAGALAAADKAIVFYNAHTLEIKKMPPLSEAAVREAFEREDLEVFTDEAALLEYLQAIDRSASNLLLMTSGRFNGMPLDQV